MNNLKEFKNWLILNKNSEYTVKTYYYKMKTFFNYYPEFSQETVNNFLHNKIENKSAPTTINLYIYTFKVYSDFSKIQIELPKQKRIQEKIKPYITEQELNDICIKLNIVTNNNYKWSVILKVLFYTGMRLKEITDLKRKNINLEKKLILVKDTKNGEERLISFSDSLKKLLESYFLYELEEINAFNLTRQSVNYICKTIQENFGIKFHAHLLRHSACHYFLKLLNNRYDAVQKIMGHKNVEQTIAYSLLTQDEIINLTQNAFKEQERKKK